MFPLIWAEMSQSFLFLEHLCVFRALAVFEPQIYVVVEQFGAENISLLSGRLVFQTLSLRRKLPECRISVDFVVNDQYRLLEYVVLFLQNTKIPSKRPVSYHSTFDGFHQKFRLTVDVKVRCERKIFYFSQERPTTNWRVHMGDISSDVHLN